MGQLLGVFVLFVIILFIAKVVQIVRGRGGQINNSRRQGPTVLDSRYRIKPTVMNSSEQAYFFALQKKIPQGYYIFPNMRIADIINPADGPGYRLRANRIMPKHIDFLICDKNFKPVYAIEVNGSSHYRSDRKESDEFKLQLLKEVNLPFEVVAVGTSFEQSVDRVVSELQKAPGA
jgi:hypothetical protein